MGYQKYARRLGILLGMVVLVCAQSAGAQSEDGPARGAIGVVRGQVGVDRDKVDDRARCARDRLVGQRPAVGVERTPVGVERTASTTPFRPDPSVASDPCAEEDSSDEGVVEQMMAPLLAGLRSVVQMARNLAGVGGL